MDVPRPSSACFGYPDRGGEPALASLPQVCARDGYRYLSVTLLLPMAGPIHLDRHFAQRP